MAQPGPKPEWDEVRRALRQLEDRVARLEVRLEQSPAAAEPPSLPEATPAQTAWVEGASAVPILGRALLGLAGAYVLRALTESRALSPALGVSAAVFYAVAWLVWAARTPAGRRAETVLYSLTSALVLGPLLWESTLRLHVVPTWVAATVLLLFTIFGLRVSWHKNLLIVATIATLTGVLTAAALLIGSHDVVPFAFLLLAIAAAVEVSACLEHWLSERWLTAAAADLVVLLATYLVTNARGLPEGYTPISPLALMAAQMALPTIYLSSTMVRTLLRGFTFTGFETAQVGTAFLLALSGGLRLAGSHPWIGPAMAAVSLACAVACYAVSFLQDARNFHTYAVFGFLLLVAGTLIAFPASVAASIWSVLAIAAMAARKPAWRWHGCFYLFCALLASSALAHATNFVLSSADGADALAWVLAEAGAAVACYALVIRGRRPGRLLEAILAGVAFWLLGGLTAAALTRSYHGLFGVLASHAWCATLRTMVLAGGAVLLAWAGTSWKRAELTPLIYVVMALGAYRLVLIDLRQDGKAALVLSLLAYGSALMLLPRLMQGGRTASG